MNVAYIDFGSNIKVIIMRNTTLVQYVTFDYSEDLLSHLYALLNDLQLNKIVYCLPTYFSESIYLDSVALEHTQLAISNGYFCVSIKDLAALQHLSKSLKVKNSYFTERRFMCHKDGIYVFEFSNLYHVYTIVSGNLTEYSVMPEGNVEAYIQHFSLKYALKDCYNFVTGIDFSMLSSLFDNIFSVSDNSVLQDLTYMAQLLGATLYQANDYFLSEFSQQSLVGVSDDNDSNSIAPSQAKTEPKQADDMMQQLLDDINDTNDIHDDDTVAQPKQKLSGKQMLKHKKQSRLSSDGDDDFDTSSLRNKSTKKSNKFSLILIMVILIMVIIIAVLMLLNSREQSLYNQQYNAYIQANENLKQLESKYAMYSSLSTTDASDAVTDILKDKLIKKNKAIKLQSFDIEGSTVSLTIKANSDEDFWDFYDEFAEKYNVTNVLDGDEAGGNLVYIINMIL